MLTLPPSVRIFIALEPTDMRKQFDGLYAKAREVTDVDPFLCGGLRYVTGGNRPSAKPGIRATRGASTAT